MDWTEDTSKALCFVAGAMAAACVLIAAARLLYAYGIWAPPSLPPPLGGILLWVFLALSILFSMDRGLPSEGLWGRRLHRSRRVLLVSVLFTVGVVIFVG